MTRRNPQYPQPPDSPDDYGFDPIPGSRRPRGLRALFHQGENPLLWALPLFRVSGIQVRLSLLFILFVAFELIYRATQGAFVPAVMMVSGLFVLILLHEFGHCIACRMVGGTADDILMWPLGGLAMCRPPHTWRANFITTAGGPLVNVILMPVLGGVILATGGTMEAVIFNPFNYTGAWASYAHSWWQSWLWWAYFTNAFLLAFNVLWPMFPLDGGRLLHALIWRTSNHHNATQVASTLGLFLALVLACFGIVTNEPLLLAIAVFGATTCWNERQRLKFLGEGLGMGSGEGSGGGGMFDRGEEESPYAASLRLADDPAGSATATARRTTRQDQEAAETAEVDRILLKIAKSGMDSLTGKERKTLKHATNRRRLQ